MSRVFFFRSNPLVNGRIAWRHVRQASQGVRLGVNWRHLHRTQQLCGEVQVCGWGHNPLRTEVTYTYTCPAWRATAALRRVWRGGQCQGVPKHR